jgi:sorbitol-specific phosphotransferase system component IIBC
MATLLPQKSDEIQPLAKCDETWAQLAADKSVDAIPQGSKFGQAPATSRDTYSAQQDQSKLIQSSGGAMQEGATVLVENDKDSTDWINKKMRPMMGWVYMLTCFCDFVVFPILWSVLQALSNGQVTSQWMPLTLQGAGLYHIAMGAVLGIAAYGRTKEKVAGVA